MPWICKKKLCWKTEWLCVRQISTASRIHLVDGIRCSLASRAFFIHPISTYAAAWTENLFGILKEILAPSKLESAPSQRISWPAGGCFKCDKSRCDLCKNYFVESRNFSSLKKGKSYSIRPNLTCDSKNVIYLASCTKCQLQYIGSTTTEFKVRFKNHKSSMVTNKKSCEVAVHFNSTSHSL